MLLLDVLRSYFVWWLQYLDQFTWQLTSSLKVGLFYTLASSGLRVGQSKCGSILLTANQKSVNFMIDQSEGNRFLFVTPGWFCLQRCYVNILYMNNSILSFCFKIIFPKTKSSLSRCFSIVILLHELRYA